MPLITRLLRRRRLDADLIWRQATRHAEDAERVRREAGLSQSQAYVEAVSRIIGQARRHAA